MQSLDPKAEAGTTRQLDEMEKAQTERYRVIRCEKRICQEGHHELIQEEPLLIRVDDRPYSVVMRTPGEEIAHAAGFCLGEGLVDDRGDFAAVGYCEDLDPNVVDVTLKPERREQVPDILERRGFISQTSCGICGKELIKDLYQILRPVDDDMGLTIDEVLSCLEKLSETQAYYSRTRGSHSAMVLDPRLKLLSFAEDVGRHNALDKAIGKVLLSGHLGDARVCVLSSRVSYELVQKSARARVPIILSKSRPTALAVEMGKALNMTFACSGEESELIIFCGEDRIKRSNI
ncbi:MAG: formate dehydrogenase accessory sulfurtransferase FdhD [Deltaproteobacteria bacterium]|nr:formate dehydrogenase accessory sulfurtransferase FdhD [Deltaproteobacteria bacterium]